MNVKKVIVTGAAGFTGAVLTEMLREYGHEIYAIVRPGSVHNKRLNASDPFIHLIELNPESYDDIPRFVDVPCDAFIHLMWGGERNDETQFKNVDYSLSALRSAKACGCDRFICTGSQAEYGVVPPNETAFEDRVCDPFSAYGKAKVRACNETKKLASELGIDWIWGRIFSLIGKYEPSGRMLPDLYHTLRSGKDMHLSSCRQNWDYLDVHDAADAIIALMKKGHGGEIYNIANGDYKPLKEFTDELRGILTKRADEMSKDNDGKIAGLIDGHVGNIIYGEDPDPFVSLQPSVEKLKRDTGFTPRHDFRFSIRSYDM